jgi:hypothetical protein
VGENTRSDSFLKSSQKEQAKSACGIQVKEKKSTILKSKISMGNCPFASH